MKTSLFGLGLNDELSLTQANLVKTLNASSQLIIFDTEEEALNFADQQSKRKQNNGLAYYLRYTPVLKVTLKNNKQHEIWPQDSSQIKITHPDNVLSIAGYIYKYEHQNAAPIKKISFLDSPLAFPAHANSAYLSFPQFKQKCIQISQRFLSSKLTQLKTTILDDFALFYMLHYQDPKYMPRTKLVKKWITEYQKNYHTNPFSLLNKQRREGVLSIFNPTITSSRALFNHFLVGELIPDPLRLLMDDLQNPHTPNLSNQ